MRYSILKIIYNPKGEKKLSDNLLKRYKEIIRDGQGTLVIILINLMIFIALNIIPNIADKLLLSPEINIIIERPWTLITVFFSHQIHLHFILNMALLFIFGLELEKITNSKLLFSLYLLAGFIGSLVIIPVAILIGTEILIAGASAAVFGIVTTFAVMRPDALILRSKAKWWALSLFIFNAIIVLSNPQTSDAAAAHVAGIIVGVVFGLLLKHKKTQKKSIN